MNFLIHLIIKFLFIIKEMDMHDGIAGYYAFYNRGNEYLTNNLAHCRAELFQQFFR